MAEAPRSALSAGLCRFSRRPTIKPSGRGILNPDDLEKV